MCCHAADRHAAVAAWEAAGRPDSIKPTDAVLEAVKKRLQGSEQGGQTVGECSQLLLGCCCWGAWWGMQQLYQLHPAQKLVCDDFLGQFYWDGRAQ